MSEETRDISYIIIDKENYSEQFTPSEISIQKYHQEKSSTKKDNSNQKG